MIYNKISRKLYSKTHFFKQKFSFLIFFFFYTKFCWLGEETFLFKKKMDRSTPTVLHNNTPYYVNLAQFVELSIYARGNILGVNPPIQINDSLDEPTFSLLVQGINDINSFNVTPEIVIPVLKAALTFDIPIFLEKIQTVLCNTNLIDLGIQTLEYASRYKILENFERFLSFNFISYMRNPHFVNLPCFVIYRIITWYNPTFSLTPEILDFYFKVLQVHGPQATPIFLTLPFETLQPQILINILQFPNIDLDTIGPVIEKYLHKTEEDRQRLQQDIQQKANSLAASHDELVRAERELDKAKERQRHLTQKLSELNTKKQNLFGELQSYDEKLEEIAQEISSKKSATQETLKLKEKSLQEKNQIVKETEDLQDAITILKQQIMDRELLQRNAAKAKELARQDEEARKAASARQAAEKAKLEEQKKIQQQQEEEEKSKQPPAEQNQEMARPKYVEPILSGIEFNDKDFMKAFLQKDDIRINITTPPSLKYALETKDVQRSSELEYLWRCQDLGDPRSRSDYGALLALSDPFAIDLASTLIFEAAERKEPYALFNAAALILLGKVDGSKEEASNYIAEAAKLGEPDACLIVKKLVHWEVASN